MIWHEADWARRGRGRDSVIVFLDAVDRRMRAVGSRSKCGIETGVELLRGDEADIPPWRRNREG